MTKPVLNFVWVGPPRFDQGGQDIVGPETIDANFKAFPELNSPPNPMVFWCQSVYVRQYQEYFTSKGIAIHVASIEDYLKTCETEKDKAQIILEHYHELIETPGRNQILDRVYLKDMFFNLILATKGDYVLDTNVQATGLEKPVYFPAYDKFMFPWVKERKFGPPKPDVWMQFAPPKSELAKQLLDCYLDLYKKAREIYQDYLYSEIHHRLIGIVAVNAACLQNNLMKNMEIISTYQNDYRDTWAGGLLIDGSDVNITPLGVSKEYYNSHKDNQEDSYGGPQMHAYNGNLEKLNFDLTHGINPDIEANIRCHIHYTNNETLLHIAMRYSNEPGHRRCVQLLLTSGADANKIYSIKYSEMSHFQQESPLTSSIKTRTEEAIQVLFTYAKTPVNVDQILNHESPLIVAVRCDTGVNLLLQYHANPNQHWPEQKDTPLAYAVRESSVNNIDLLLMAGADPNTPVRQNNTYQNGKRIISETPLHIALKNKDAITVQKLLKHGADPFIIAQYKLKMGSVIKQTTTEIETSETCRQILAAAIQKYHQDHPDEPSSSHATSIHGMFKPVAENKNPMSDLSEKPSETTSDTKETQYRPFTPPN